MSGERGPRKRAARPIAARLGPALVFLTVLVVAALAAATAWNRNDERRGEALDSAARGAAQAIDRRMRAYTDVLYATAGLFEASRAVTAREFRSFLAKTDTLRRYPGVRSIGYARLEAGPPPRLVVTRLEPPNDADRAIGIDLMREPNRRRAALRAARTGHAEGTAPLRPLLGGTIQPVFLLLAPIYDPQRRWAGAAFAGFRMGDLLHGVLGSVPSDVDLEIYDVGRSSTAPVDAAMLDAGRQAYNLRGGRDAMGRDPDRSRLSTVDVAGRRWAVYYAESGSPLTGLERAAPWTILAGGLVLALLAAALLRSQVTAEERAIALADRRTAELHERERELERSNAELEHFAYLASHDLQEPLRTITAYSALLERRLDDDLDERARSWMRFITDAAQRMSELISDLLEYSRAGLGDSRTATVSLDEAWDTAVTNLEQAIADAGAEVTRDALPVVEASRREMVSLLQNLIANGLKYRDSRPPRVHASAMRRDGEWELRITDNGIGIDPRFHERIFGLFQRLHTPDEYPGTGMGLAIVRKLAEANGGAVAVESEPGRGSTFVVTLPTAEDG